MVDTPRASIDFGGVAKPLGFGFQIRESSTPHVVLRLEENKKFIAQSGTMMKKTAPITMEMSLGNGKAQGGFGKLLSGLKRNLAGDDFLTQLFTNTAGNPQELVLAAPHPGEILAIDLHQFGGKIFCQRGAFLAGPSGTEVAPKFRQKLTFALFGREEFVMQKISGDDFVFLHAGGGLHVDDLAEGEEIQIDTGCLVATTKGVTTSVTKAGSWASTLLGDEGFFLVNCKGPGRVWMQSMPFSREVKTITDEQARQSVLNKSAVTANPK